MKHTLPHLVLAVEVEPVPLVDPLHWHLKDDGLHVPKAMPGDPASALIGS